MFPITHHTPLRFHDEQNCLFTSQNSERRVISGVYIITECEFFFFSNIYLVTILLMTILTFTWRKNKNKVQEIKEKYDVTAFATN